MFNKTIEKKEILKEPPGSSQCRGFLIKQVNVSWVPRHDTGYLKKKIFMKTIWKIFCPTTVPVLAHFDQHKKLHKTPQNMHNFKNWKKIRLYRKKSKSRVFGSFFALFCPRKIIFSKIQRCHALSWRNFELSGWTDGHTDRGNFIGPFPSFLGGPKNVG